MSVEGAFLVRRVNREEPATSQRDRVEATSDTTCPAGPSFSQPSGCGLSPAHALVQIEHLDPDHTPLAVEI
jgi:hypothetical protein